jgi:hypothetical protein
MVTSPAALSAPGLELRERVRAFRAETLRWGTFAPGLGMGAGVDRAFPAAYGGRDATYPAIQSGSEVVS